MIKVGDYVRVLENPPPSYSMYWNPQMDRFKGKICKITKVKQHHSIYLFNLRALNLNGYDSWNFVEEWLVKLLEEEALAYLI